MQNEEKIWSDTPSQILNLKVYLFCIFISIISFFIADFLNLKLLPLLISSISLVYCFWKFLVLKNHVYSLTNERLKIEAGVFNKHYEEIELYRVKDSSLEKPFVLRLFNLGNLVLITSDSTMPHVFINAISNSTEVREKIRQYVENNRKSRHVREIDMN